MGSNKGFVSRLFMTGTCSVALLVSLSGCGKEQATPEPEQSAAVETASDPYQPGAPLPPNHPPLEPAADGGMPADHAQHAQLAGEGEMMGHPPQVLSESKEVEVVVPENIKGKWAAVQLAVSGKDSDKSELTVPIGGQTDIQGGIVVVVDEFLPDYTSDFEKATSASDTLNNPAALVHLMKADKVLAKGWVFKNYPEFNTFNSNELKIELLDAKPAEETN